MQSDLSEYIRGEQECYLIRMVFSFFPIVVVIYFLLPKKISYLWLLAASYYFYMGWNAKYALLLLVSTTITYVSGILIQWLNDRHPDKICAKKWVVAGSFISNLAILFFLNTLILQLKA